MPQTFIVASAIVIGLLLLAIGGCHFAQGRKRKRLEDRQVLTLSLSPVADPPLAGLQLTNRPDKCRQVQSQYPVALLTSLNLLYLD